MKRLLFAILILIIALVIGWQIKTNPGYVFITTQHWTVETRLWVAIMLGLVLFYLLYILIRLFTYIFSLPVRWHRWRKQKKIQKATEFTYHGLVDLAGGDYSHAQKYLLQEMRYAPVPLVNYLGAAIAAQGNGEQEKRDAYLKQAALVMPDAKLAIGLVQAELQYEAGQYLAALATLNPLEGIAPKQKKLLKLLAKVHKKLANWQALAVLLPRVQQYRALSEQQLNNMASLTYQHLFNETDDATRLQELWQAAPKEIRTRNEIIYLYVKSLNRLGEHDAAEKLAYRTLQAQWDSNIARLYGVSISSNVKKQLSHAESWLAAQRRDANLLFTLARLAEHNKLWGKAKDYYYDSLQVRPDPEVYAAYANLLEQLGEVKESLVYYRKGLRAVSKNFNDEHHSLK